MMRAWWDNAVVATLVKRVLADEGDASAAAEKLAVIVFRELDAEPSLDEFIRRLPGIADAMTASLFDLLADAYDKQALEQSITQIRALPEAPDGPVAA